MTQQEALNRELEGAYRLDEQIGQGGMANVYRAYDVKHDRTVAIKVLRPELTLGVGIERFNREVRYAAGLQHPHILPVYDSGNAAGAFYYVMPFVDGDTLQDRLARYGRMPVDEVLRIIRKLADALSYAHDRNVVHRDIKPANVMLSGQEPVLTDFGVAKVLSAAGDEALTHTGFAVGTPAYMSPEQAAGEIDVDGRSDVYSLGCVMHELLAGTPPYHGQTAQAIMSQRFAKGPTAIRKLRPEVPASVEAVLNRALARLPEDRFQSAAEMASAIDAVLTGDRVAVGFGRRRTGRLVAAGLVLAAVVSAAIFVPGRLGRSGIVPDAAVIAVLPFNVSGGGLGLLSEGMVDLLSTNLDGVGGIRTVDPRAVMHRWTEAGPGRTSTLEDGLSIARDLSAGSVLTGSMVEAGSEVRVTAELHSVTGELLARVQLDGPTDSVLSLVDNLSLDLLRRIWVSREPLPDLRVSAMTTSSLDAVRSYLRGEQFYRLSAWDSAVAQFERAVEEDPDFALAWLRLAHSYGWIEGHGSTTALRYLARAESLSDRLPERERGLMAAHRLFEEGRMQAIDSLRSYVARYPDDAEGWYELGDALYHARNVIAATPEEIYAPFERAMQLVPSFSPNLIHPTELALVQGDRSRFDRYLAAMDSLDPSRAATFRRFSLAVWDSSETGANAAIELARTDPNQLGLLANAFYENPAIDAERVLVAIDSAIANSDSLESPIRSIRARFLASLGRLNEASAEVSRVFSASPQLSVFASIYPVIAGFAEPLYAGRGMAVLRAMPQDQAIGRYWRGVYAAATGDTTALAQELGQGSPVDTTMAGLMNGLRGWQSILRGDTALGLRQIEDGLEDTGFRAGVSSFSGPLNFEAAVTAAARPETRQIGVQHLRHGVGSDFEYRPLRYLSLGGVLEEAGDRQGALLAYDQFVRLWEGADTTLQPLVEEVKQRIARLLEEGSS